MSTQSVKEGPTSASLGMFGEDNDLEAADDSTIVPYQEDTNTKQHGQGSEERQEYPQMKIVNPAVCQHSESRESNTQSRPTVPVNVSLPTSTGGVVDGEYCAKRQHRSGRLAVVREGDILDIPEKSNTAAPEEEIGIHSGDKELAASTACPPSVRPNMPKPACTVSGAPAMGLFTSARSRAKIACPETGVVSTPFPACCADLSTSSATQKSDFSDIMVANPSMTRAGELTSAGPSLEPSITTFGRSFPRKGATDLKERPPITSNSIGILSSYQKSVVSQCRSPELQEGGKTLNPCL